MGERTTALELAILGLLKQQELHGYELKKRLVDTLGVTSAVSFGSLYPALARLEAAGAVKAVAAASRSPIPHTGSLGGELAAFRARVVASRPSRGKKVYGITDVGEQRFVELLAADPRADDDERAFTLRLAFARYLPVEVRLRLMERRRMQLVERRSLLATRLRAGQDRLDGYGRSLMEHDRDMTEHDITWLDGMIAAERLPDPPTPFAAPAAGPVTSLSTQDPSQALEDHHQ
jgi:DNA-binding PadR family transcriptional regulator